MGERLKALVGRDLGVWMISAAFAGAALVSLAQVGWALLGGWFIPLRVWLSLPFFLGMAVLYPLEASRDAGAPTSLFLRLARVVVGGFGLGWFVVSEVLGASRMLSAVVFGAIVGATLLYLALRSRARSDASAVTPSRPATGHGRFDDEDIPDAWKGL